MTASAGKHPDGDEKRCGHSELNYYQPLPTIKIGTKITQGSRPPTAHHLAQVLNDTTRLLTGLRWMTDRGYVIPTLSKLHENVHNPLL
jgi:hypothetical protein